MMSANSSPTRWRRPYRGLSLAAILLVLGAIGAKAQSPGVPYINPQKLAIPAIGNDLNALILNINQALGVSTAPNGLVTGPGVSTAGFIPTWVGTAGTSIGTGLPATVTSAPNSLVKLNGAGQLDPSIIPPTSNPIYRQAVMAATAAVLPNSPTYSNGASGVNATLTAGSNVALTVDTSYSVLLNDRILVQNQVNQAQNGIYTETQVGSGVQPWVLTRATDFNTPALANIELGVSVVTVNGTTNANKAFFFNQETCTYPSFTSCVVGQTAFTWALVSTQQSYTASNGISLAANNFTLSTISNNQVLGNVSGITAAPIGLTTTQLTALINQVTPTLSGAVPATGGSSTTNFLRADLTWSPIATIANNTVLGNVSGSSAGAAAITATQLTTLCNQFTSALSGCVSGSGGGTTKFLRADNTWAATGSALGLQVCTPLSAATYTLAYGSSTQCTSGSDANGIIPVTGGGTLTINASSAGYFPAGSEWAVEVPIGDASAVIALGAGAAWGTEGNAPIVTSQVTVPAGTGVQIITDPSGNYVPIATNFGYSNFTQTMITNGNMILASVNGALIGPNGPTSAALSMDVLASNYSTTALAGDTVLRSGSGNQLILQEDAGAAALYIDATNIVHIVTPPVTALTDGAGIVVTATSPSGPSFSQTFTDTLTTGCVQPATSGCNVIENPTNGTVGQKLIFLITQNASLGPFDLCWGSGFGWASGGVQKSCAGGNSPLGPVINPVPNSITEVDCTTVTVSPWTGLCNGPVNGDVEQWTAFGAQTAPVCVIAAQTGAPIIPTGTQTPAVATVTASPAVGCGVEFTGGTLPTGITAGAEYFVISAGHTSTQFEFSTTSGGSAVNTSGTSSGTQTATTQAYQMMGLSSGVYRLTPHTTGNYACTVTGVMTQPSGSATANFGLAMQLFYGSGTGPANAALPNTGVPLGLVNTYTLANAPAAIADVNVPWTMTTNINSLPLNTNYWVDIAAADSTGTVTADMSISNVTFSCHEVR